MQLDRQACVRATVIRVDGVDMMNSHGEDQWGETVSRSMKDDRRNDGVDHGNLEVLTVVGTNLAEPGALGT
jgi:hypothetical protein